MITTMKKTYITPSFEEIKAMQQNLMVTGSISDVTVDPEQKTETMDAKESLWSDEEAD